MWAGSLPSPILSFLVVDADGIAAGAFEQINGGGGAANFILTPVLSFGIIIPF